MRLPSRSRASTAGMAASSLCSCSGCSFTFAPIALSSLAVWRVSSQRIRSAASSVSRARSVRSPRLPIGVETSTRPSGRTDCPSRPRSGDVAHASSGIRAPSRHTSTRGLRWRIWLWASRRYGYGYGGAPVPLGSGSPPTAGVVRPGRRSRSCCRCRAHEPISASRCCMRRSSRSTGRVRRRWTQRTPAGRPRVPPPPPRRRSPMAPG